MSMQALIQLKGELFRLSMAGCGLAKDDIRLEKPLTQLRASAAAAPIFGRVADLGETLRSTGAATTFMELCALCDAVLTTRYSVKTVEDKVLIQLEPKSYPKGTPLSYRGFAQLKEALTGRGSGRVAVLRSYVDSGIRPDIRLWPALAEALGDSYHEIPDMAELLLRRFDREILPYLEELLDIERVGSADARILRIIGDFSRAEALPLYRQIGRAHV